MPICEYRCRKCGKKPTLVTLSVRAAVEPICRKRASAGLAKLVSRPAVRRPEESRRERLSGPSRLAGLDEDDPRAMARRVNMTGKEPGEDAGEDDDE